jgi:hypothetical protein
MRLAQMAGVSIGTSTILIACHCDAPTARCSVDDLSGIMEI